MSLILKWIGLSGNIYSLGELSKKDDEYIFKIDMDNLKKAIADGCVGIGNFDLLKEEYRSTELFDFFKNRIISKENPRITDFLKRYGLNEYDEMEILKLTKAKLETDRYFVY